MDKFEEVRARMREHYDGADVLEQMLINIGRKYLSFRNTYNPAQHPEHGITDEHIVRILVTEHYGARFADVILDDNELRRAVGLCAR